MNHPLYLDACMQIVLGCEFIMMSFGKRLVRSTLPPPLGCLIYFTCHPLGAYNEL